MITLKNRGNPVKVGEGMYRNELEVIIEGETMGMALNMLIDAIQRVADTVLEKHAPDCKCMESKFAKLTKTHMTMLHEEMMTTMAGKKILDDQDLQRKQDPESDQIDQPDRPTDTPSQL